MREWFDRQPLRRTLVISALGLAAIASTVAVGGTIAADVWRYHATAADDTRVLARVIAENVAATVVFGDVTEARAILAATGVRPTVRRACLYLPDGRLFAQFERAGGPPCPASPASPAFAATWFTVSGSSSIGRPPVGTVVVERELPELWMGLGLTATAGLLMVCVAGLIAMPLAARLHRRVSEPIERLAAAVRTVGASAPASPLLPIETELPEIRALSRAFVDMVARIDEATDALRRKEAEREDLLRREREANRLKDEFLAAVSHELRTPLNAILGWSQILTTTKPDAATAARALETIARNARAQARLIDDLVDVSRIVVGKLAMRVEPLDLREPVESALEAVRASAEARQLTMSPELPPARCLVCGDRDRLRQIFVNLLSNAVKFSRPGGTVRLAVRAAADGVEVVVADDGVGIPEEFLAHAFEPFRQADGSTTREHGGLGLGLSIARELTTLHHGTIQAASAGRGLGSTFTVRLPALDEASPAEAVRTAGTIDGVLAGLRVLAVDDNRDALEVLSLTLQRAGAVVTTASSGAEALQRCVGELPDVLLCDLAMPDLDGFEVLQRVRRNAPAGRPTAIAVSAHVTPQHRARSAEVGFSAHLAKPYTLEAVVDTVRRAWHEGRVDG